MSKLTDIAHRVFARERVILAGAALLAISGVTSWFTMPREEDPRLGDRFGVLVIPFPGATAEMVERLVVDPLEENVFQVDDVKQIRTTARANVAVFAIELIDNVKDTSEAWDEVAEGIESARGEFPTDVGEPRLQKRIIVDQDAIVLAVTGTEDLVELLGAAEHTKEALLHVPGVAEVNLSADPGEQVTVRLDDVALRRLGLSMEQVAMQLSVGARTIPGGSVYLDGRVAMINTGSDYSSLEELLNIPVTLASGASVPLREVAEVFYGPNEPAETRMRFSGEPGVAVAVVPKENIDVVGLGGRVREVLSVLESDVAPLQLQVMSFQPDFVSERLSGLGRSLALGIGIVALVLILAMGFRLGVVVASVVPLVALTGLTLYAGGGGVLHQISVAAMVIALGMLVDNAIVVAESIQRRIDEGISPRSAAAQSVGELAMPLLTATGTTLAAFIPMYASEGSTGEFTRAIPVVIMLTLSASYVFAVLVTPVISALALRPSVGSAGRDRWHRGMAELAGRWATHFPRRVILGAGLAVVASGVLAGWVDRSFFPRAGRNQLVVELMMPEGTHLDATDQSAQLLEAYLLEREDVEAVASFVGRSSPKFYYNLPNRPSSPHFAHLMVQTTGASRNDGVARGIRDFASASLPQAEVIPRALKQGPPIDAPVELRIFGDDLQVTQLAAETLIAELRTIEGTVNVRHNMGQGAPTLEFDVADGAAALRGVGRPAVALAVLGQTRGRKVGELRYGDDPVPLVVRSSAGEYLPPDSLIAVDVPTQFGGTVPVGHVAAMDVAWRPAAIHHRKGERVVTVSAQLLPGYTYSSALAELAPTLETLELPATHRVEIGGAAEGSGDANLAIVRAAPLGVLLLLMFLLIEFNSFRRLGIILSTFPLAAVGVVPGLLITSQPFGFMSLLGVIALSGIVVNNAIVLLDLVELRRKEGRTIPEALREAIATRTRPILLTSVTTVAGLLPLALSESPLWPPMASAMIAGLIASTILTLVVVPALYSLIFREEVVS